MILLDRLKKRKEEGTFRSLSQTEGLIDFTSNDYLGFSRSAELLKRAQRGVKKIGATGSRLLTGNYPLYEEIEAKLAAFHRTESAVIFNTGYTANLGLLAALGTAESTFLYDIESHASIYDGMRLSKAKCLPFRHNDLDSLEKRLRRAVHPVYVLVEAIYSISGDFAPLQKIAALCKQYSAELIVDEAHATGVRGLNGEGLSVEYGIENNVFARVHTFSKALGIHGAAVLGSRTLKEYLLNFSRPLIYTTSLPPLALSLIACAYEKLQREAKKHQHRLSELIEYFQIATATPRTRDGPIQSLYSADSEKVKRQSKTLQENGLDVRAILPPTVPRGKACLRIVLHSFNTKDEIDCLCALL